MGTKLSSPLWEPVAFGKNSVQNLRDEIETIHTELKLKWPSKKIRIVICACGKDGKSSTINNILSALEGKYTQTADIGGQPNHITHKYIEYKMLIGKVAFAKETPFLVCDTPGLRGDDEARLQVQIEVIKAAIMGKFKSGDMLHSDKLTEEDLNKMKPIQEVAACVIFVIDSTRTDLADPHKVDRVVKSKEAFEKMKSILQFIQTNDITTACLLTKCDRLDNDVAKKLRYIYYSKNIEAARLAISSSFNGFPMDRIFPIVNYTQRLEVKKDMMVQILFALKHILGDIQSKLERSVS